MSEVSITVRDNGPLLVSGPVTLKDAEGNVFNLQGKETFALCRCGRTENRPFCDGQHKQIGFQACDRATS